MKSLAIETNKITLPLITGEYSMIPFCLKTLDGLTGEFKEIVDNMLKGINQRKGTAYFTFHGKTLKKGGTLRRGGAHTDGNYEPVNMSFGSGGGGGWKVGENGAPINTAMHDRQYVNPLGGIILASNYEACNGWVGEYDNTPKMGGDCSHIKLDEPFKLKVNQVYYGNNHFIHESLPMSDDVHRVFARITLPENHEYKAN